MKSAIVTARITVGTLERLDKLASDIERSRAWIVGKAIERYVEDEASLDAALAEGEADFANGDIVTHEQLVAEIRAMRHKDAA